MRPPVPPRSSGPAAQPPRSSSSAPASRPLTCHTYVEQAAGLHPRLTALETFSCYDRPPSPRQTLNCSARQCMTSGARADLQQGATSHRACFCCHQEMHAGTWTCCTGDLLGTWGLGHRGPGWAWRALAVMRLPHQSECARRWARPRAAPVAPHARVRRPRRRAAAHAASQ